MEGTEWEAAVARHREEERRRRNEQLARRLMQARTFEQLARELASLKGFNVPERLALFAQKGRADLGNPAFIGPNACQGFPKKACANI